MARYFVHLPPDGSPAIYSRAVGNFSGLPFHYNLNLLARALGDEPSAVLPVWGELVPPSDYNFEGGTVRIQPFACTPQGGNVNRPEALPIGPNLLQFLNDPLSGEAMDLSLPFYDEDIKLGPSGGGWLRKEINDAAFHGGTDFLKRPRAVFDVCAAADGRFVARDSTNGKQGGSLVLSHVTLAGKEFRTIYQHVDVNTIPAALQAGTPVRRGQYLGRTIDVSIIHLHFAVAVQGPAVRLSGMSVPPLWFFIDPWGVYDYYEHDNRSNSNYLPPESQADIFRARVTGAVHTVQWRTQPLVETIPIARNTEGSRTIARIEARAREGENFGGTLPEENQQFRIWLQDDPDPYVLPIAESIDRASVLGLETVLREAFFHGKQVRLEYRHAGDLRYVMAVFVNG